MKLIPDFPVAKLKPYARNPRQHEEADVSSIMESIKHFGFKTPIMIQKGTNRIVAGHGRLEAAKRLGLKAVPVLEVEFKDELDVQAYTIADNATAEQSKWDWPLLQAELVSLRDQGFEIKLTGFPDHQLENIMAGDWKLPAMGSLNGGAGEPDTTGMVAFHATEAQAEVIRQAIDKAKDGNSELTQGRALELICADYLSGK